jgi:uncharacterized protein
MSALIDLDNVNMLQSPPRRRRFFSSLADRARARTRTADDSPTTSILSVLASLGIGLSLALILGARGIIHAGNGMEYGTERNVTLSVGNAALNVGDLFHASWPWDEAERALGRTAQPAIPPLLAMGPGPGSPTPGGIVSTPVSQQQGIAPVPARTKSPSVTPRPTGTQTPSPTASADATQGTRRGPSSGPTFYPRPATMTADPSPRPTEMRATSTPTPVVGKPGIGRPTKHHGKTARATATSTSTPKPAPRTSNSAGRKSVIQPTPTVQPTPIPQLRALTAAAPLQLLVTGDSLTGYLGPILINEAASAGAVKGYVDTHNGTGLTRPDFVDWSVVAQQQVTSDHPDAVVVMMGGNDFQNMTLPNGAFFQAGTPAWTKEYQRRAEICMRIWTQGGKARVYWLSMVPARNTDWAHDDGQINIALQRAAADVPGAEYLNILGPVTVHGRYSDFVNQNGQPVLIREQDGVHLNAAGSTIVAKEVLTVLKREWQFGTKQR